MRGADTADTGPTTLRPESKIHWVVQPEQAVAEPLELATIVRGEDVTCLARPESVRASDSGALELRGTVQQTLGLTPGRWSVELVVARPGVLPGDREARQCVHPRDLPCPCPPEVRPGSTVDSAPLDPERGAEAWRRVDSLELLVE